MAGPFSNDLRERVAVAVAEGRSCRFVAELFHVSPSSVSRWSQRRRTTGSAAAKPMGGVRRNALGDHRDWLRDRIKQKPDLTLRALKSELVVRGASVSIWVIWKFCVSEGFSFKKTISGARPACGGRNGLRYRSEGSGRWLFGGMTPQKNVAHGLLRTCMW
jgi:transposase